MQRHAAAAAAATLESGSAMAGEESSLFRLLFGFIFLIVFKIYNSQTSRFVGHFSSPRWTTEKDFDWSSSRGPRRTHAYYWWSDIGLLRNLQ